ncbi:hypothetical protein FN846DRAFT_937023 [Sphaerosporella brunnea]|uniref:Uncharacterized protein n=1 Tax=Sphaerosporella brunnea TaxID=1250544 RepID=A0A5J5F4Q0_9PEZI|nr:hypothetical protein FN846DRAFT_937023 [Sphaerosporella brunnea]
MLAERSEWFACGLSCSLSLVGCGRDGWADGRMGILLVVLLLLAMDCGQKDQPAVHTAVGFNKCSAVKSVFSLGQALGAGWLAANFSWVRGRSATQRESSGWSLLAWSACAMLPSAGHRSPRAKIRYLPRVHCSIFAFSTRSVCTQKSPHALVVHAKSKRRSSEDGRGGGT